MDNEDNLLISEIIFSHKQFSPGSKVAHKQNSLENSTTLHQEKKYLCTWSLYFQEGIGNKISLEKYQ